jgi:hypothetical protein
MASAPVRVPSLMRRDGREHEPRLPGWQSERLGAGSADAARMSGPTPRRPGAGLSHGKIASTGRARRVIVTARSGVRGSFSGRSSKALRASEIVSSVIGIRLYASMSKRLDRFSSARSAAGRNGSNVVAGGPGRSGSANRPRRIAKARGLADFDQQVPDITKVARIRDVRRMSKNAEAADAKSGTPRSCGSARFSDGGPSRTRTLDPLIKSDQSIPAEVHNDVRLADLYTCD